MTVLRDEVKLTAPFEAMDECSDLDADRGDWFDTYAVLVSPELITLDGTCRDQVKLLRCVSGHLHLPTEIFWEGPVSPIGFAEFWERKSSLIGEPLARLQSHIRELPPGERLVVGPGRLA